MEFLSMEGIEGNEQSRIMETLYSRETTCQNGRNRFLWLENPDFTEQVPMRYYVPQETNTINPHIHAEMYNGGNNFPGPPPQHMMQQQQPHYPAAPAPHQPQYQGPPPQYGLSVQYGLMPQGAAPPPHQAVPQYMPGPGQQYLPQGYQLHHYYATLAAAAAAHNNPMAGVPLMQHAPSLQPPACTTNSELITRPPLNSFGHHGHHQEANRHGAHPPPRKHERVHKKRNGRAARTDVNKNLTAEAPEFVPRAHLDWQRTMNQQHHGQQHHAQQHHGQMMGQMAPGSLVNGSEQTHAESNYMEDMQSQYLHPSPSAEEDAETMRNYRPPPPPAHEVAPEFAWNELPPAPSVDEVQTERVRTYMPPPPPADEVQAELIRNYLPPPPPADELAAEAAAAEEAVKQAAAEEAVKQAAAEEAIKKAAAEEAIKKAAAEAAMKKAAAEEAVKKAAAEEAVKAAAAEAAAHPTSAEQDTVAVICNGEVTSPTEKASDCSMTNGSTDLATSDARTVVPVAAKSQQDTCMEPENSRTEETAASPELGNKPEATPPQENGVKEAKPSQPKPSSWAGLFSSTKQAKNATVIYTSSKVVTATNHLKTSEKEADILVTVSAGEDRAAQSMGDMLNCYVLKHKSISLQPRGLTNNAVWCYINATLQALVACPPFYHLMTDLPSKRRGEATSTPVMDSIMEFAREFRAMALKPQENKALNGKGTMKMDLPVGKPFEPTYVYQLLKLNKYDGAFKHGRQEDAEEFLSSVLNWLHDEMLAVMKVARGSSQESDGASTNGHANIVEDEREESPAGEDDDGWEQVGPKNKSVITRSVVEYGSGTPISSIFRGQIRSTVTQAGERESATLQPFFSLQLDIQHRDVHCVSDALQHLMTRETIHGYTCSRTRQAVDASRRTMLEELPPVLLLHLKCFVYDDKSGGSLKLPKHIEYSVDLEINKDLLGPSVRQKYASPASRKYKLFAVVNHHGSRAVGGHYTSYTFHPGLNGWLHIDDGIITPVSLPNLMKFAPPKVPYLLYYRKVDIS